MFRNYLKIALRNLVRHKVFSAINLLGLAIGMASCILILLYVRAEFGYDRFHENADRIWRVTREWVNEEGSTSLHLGHVAPPIAPLLANDFPDILEAVRIHTPGELLVSREDLHYLEPRVIFADDNLFDVFTFPLLKGDPETALKNPYSVVLTERTAKKYFGDEDPMGKTLKIDRRIDCTVTGVAAEAPRAAHFHFDLIGALKTLEEMYGRREFENWGSNNYATYLLMPANYPIDNLTGQFPAFLDRHQGPDSSKRNRLHLQRLTDIHLRSHLDSEIETNSDISTVTIFSVVAAFILLIACVNFMNLSTARASIRAREVGLRKVVGADRNRLVRQFLGESLLMAFLALAFALLMVLAARPAFSAFVARDLSLDIARHPGLLAGFLGIALFVGAAAGAYPAFVLSSLRPVTVLKGSRGSGSHGAAFRTGLVVFQFAISIILIVGVGVVGRQLRYTQDKRLGFDKEQVVVLAMDEAMRGRYDAIRQELLALPGVVDAAGSRRVPSGRLLDSSGANVIGGGNTRPVDFRVAFVCVDYAFIDTYKMEIAAGRNFSRDHPTDATEAFILNETAVRKLGWTPEQAVGQAFSYGYGSRKGTVVGVVRDFHFESLHQEIAPLILFIRPQDFRLISVRLRPGAVPETLDFLKRRWAEWRPDFPFQYSFIDERFGELYGAERRMGQVFRGFSFLAVFIACLGLYGLASYSTEKRAKEIGIRKVMGATVPGLTVMISRDFTKWVLAANLIAWPAAYFAMKQWLQGFAYRVSLDAWPFLAAGLAAFLVALLTVSTQAVKAAVGNPADVLRSE
jgi:putative ABC transport system permease protein